MSSANPLRIHVPGNFKCFKCEIGFETGSESIDHREKYHNDKYTWYGRREKFHWRTMRLDD